MSGGQERDFSEALKAMLQLGGEMADPSKPKDDYAFWKTQPVAQFHENGEGSSTQATDGPIDAPPKTVEEVRQEPYPLPPSFEWCTCDVKNEAELKEIYQLLSNHYVEDDDNMFRFAYSPGFLNWALQPPGFNKDWHCGVRVSTTGKLVAFISGVPADIRVRDKVIKMVEINFLCVHKKLRQKRLAPVLIKEITRRVNLHNIWQAVYTAGVVLPKPVAEAQYWHRSLNPKKLVGIGFSHLGPRMTMARTIKLYKLPDKPETPGIRPMEAKDVPEVTVLINNYLKKYQLAPVFTEEDVSHWLVMRENVVYCYVVENKQDKVTDVISFYTLPSTVIGNIEYHELRAAYMFYTVPGSLPYKQLLNDALILANNTGHDVFNALDILENAELMKDLKFGIGDGKLRYYLFNWRTTGMNPSDVGLVML